MAVVIIIMLALASALLLLCAESSPSLINKFNAEASFRLTPAGMQQCVLIREPSPIRTRRAHKCVSTFSIRVVAERRTSHGHAAAPRGQTHFVTFSFVAHSLHAHKFNKNSGKIQILLILPEFFLIVVVFLVVLIKDSQ